MRRTLIGQNFIKQSAWVHYLGVPFIYVPIITMIPFVILGVLTIRFHLRCVGGLKLKSYWSFVPAWISHRYVYGEQIVYTTDARWYNFRAQKWFWIFNCKLYCPLSVALFRYCSYLVMVVENWWCPFHHDQKPNYTDGAIDKSYWHLYSSEFNKLHPEDLNNPIWNQDAEKNNDND